MDDTDIIQLYEMRDESAIKQTEEKYGARCLGIARNILNNDADAQECVNDTYLSVWNAIPPQRPANLAAYISKITRNLALKKLRHRMTQKRSHPAELSLSELEECLPDNTSFSYENDAKQLGERISAFLRAQKPDARNVFLRKYWYFDSIADIAARYSFSESKVKSMLYHTRNQLREYLKKEGIYL